MPQVRPGQPGDAQTAGRIRAQLESYGTPIGAYDLLIAGQALRRGLRVVTTNTSELGRIPGLDLVDWSDRTPVTTMATPPTDVYRTNPTTHDVDGLRFRS